MHLLARRARIAFTRWRVELVSDSLDAFESYGASRGFYTLVLASITDSLGSASSSYRIHSVARRARIAFTRWRVRTRMDSLDAFEPTALAEVSTLSCLRQSRFTRLRVELISHALAGASSLVAGYCGRSNGS